MISAAMSMSRIAIQVRPVGLRIMFFASSASSTTTARVTRNFVSAVALGPETTTFSGARKARGPPFGRERPEQGPRRGRGDAGRVVVREPANMVKQPQQEELRRERRHCEVKALDPQAWQSEDDADHGCKQAGNEEIENQRELRQSEREVVARVCSDGHE